jgi:phospholipase/carboxylesterase/glyoxalase family protein
MTAELGFVHVYRPGRGPRTLLMLHGTGGDESDLLPLAPMLDPDAGVLSPRGKVLEHGAPRFFRRLAEGVFDLEDLRARTHELADFVGAAATTYAFDPAQVTAVGFSNGANVAASVLLLRPGTLARAILFRAMVPLEPDEAPALGGTAAFLSAGKTDPIVPPSNTERLAQMLRDYGATVELRWSPGGHSLGQDDVVAARAWLDG